MGLIITITLIVIVINDPKKGIQLIIITMAPIITYIGATFRYVPPPYNWVIEKNLPGKTTRKMIWKPGIHFLWLPSPFMRVANKIFCGDKTTIITIGKQDENPGNPSKVEFSDASAGVSMQLTTRVIDPIRATYEVDNYLEASVNITEANMRRILADFTLDEAMKSVRDEATQETFLQIKEILEEWGVKIMQIAIIDFDLPESVVEHRDKIIATEKTRQALVIEAEGNAKASIIEATAKANVAKLLANGEAEAEWTKIETIAKKIGLEEVQVMAYLLTGKLTSAIDSSTIILSSGENGLNLPLINSAAIMGQIQTAMKNKGGN